MLFFLFVIRPRRCRSAAAYSHRTFPWTICESVRRSVCPVHCGKTADRIRMPFGIIGRTGPSMRQVLGFGNRSTVRGTFRGKFGARHCNKWRLYGVRVRQCLNLRSCGLGWCVQREGEVLGGFCSPFSQWEMPLGRRRWNVFDSYTKTWEHFRLANVLLESSIRGLFGIYSVSKINVGVYEKLAKSKDSSTKTQMHTAKWCCPWCADSRRRRWRGDCIFMNALHGAVLHRPRPGQPAATRPCTQITLGRLVRGRHTLYNFCGNLN